MHWATLWRVLFVAGCAAQSTRTVCDDASCRCDSFTRVICNCAAEYDEVTIRPDGAFHVPSTTTAIIIDGCSRVFFFPDTVEGLARLRNVELRNNKRIQFSERALAWSPYQRDHELAQPGLRISIQNSNVSEIPSHTFRGRIDEISITNSYIEVIRPFAFSSLTGVKNIELVDNSFGAIEIQTFKKFTTENFVLRGGYIRHLPSRFLSDVEVTNLLHIDGVNIKDISSLAFLVNSPKRVIVDRNIIGTIEGDAFHITTRGPVTFRNNTIQVQRKGALLGITVEREWVADHGLQELLLDNNTVSDITTQSLLYNRSTLTFRVDGLNLNTACSCELADEWHETHLETGGMITCWYVMEEHYLSIPTYVDTHCGVIKQNFWIFIVVGVAVILILGAIVTAAVIKIDRDKKKKVSMVMPDGKTYRETEFHIVVERAELLTTDL